MAGLAAGCSERSREGDLVLAGATLLDPVSRTASIGDVWISAGRIQSVSTGGHRSQPGAPVRRLDLRGRFVLPAFRDVGVWLFLHRTPARAVPSEVLYQDHAARRALFAGVVTCLDVFHEQGAWIRERQRLLEIEGASIRQVSLVLSGPTSLGRPNARSVLTRSAASRAVLEAAALGADAIFVLDHELGPGAGLSRDALDGAIAAARRARLPILVSVDSWERALRVVRGGADAVIGLPPGPVPEDVRAAARERRPGWIPALAAERALFDLEESPARLDGPLARVLVDPALLDLYRRPGSWEESVRELAQRQGALAAGRKEAVQTLVADGARLIAGSRAGLAMGAFHGASIHWEMERLLEAGLSTWDVLAAATINAGPLLREAPPEGLSTGAPADLVVLDASPFESIRNTQRLAAVIHRGRLVDREALLR